jgi:hypothetical protein
MPCLKQNTKVENFLLFFVTFKQIINLSHETPVDICIEDNIRYDVNKNDLIERDVTVYRKKALSSFVTAFVDCEMIFNKIKISENRTKN